MAEDKDQIEDIDDIVEKDIPESNEEDQQDETQSNGSDAELDDAGDDDEREAIRARRREERQQKKEWRKENDDKMRREREMLRKENEALASRLAALEQRAVGSEFAQIDMAIDNTARAIMQIKEQIKYATEASDGTTVAEATEKLFQTRNYFDHLNNVKKNAANQSRQIEQRSPVDPRVRRQAETWAEVNTWYDPVGNDSDSKVAKMLDQELSDEGWNPQEPEYWSELDARLKRYLPHRYAQSQRETTRQTTRTPVTGSGREGSGGGSTTGWKLSAERVAAIKEAGAWDDAEKRDRMIKNYRAYDKQNSK